MLFVSVSVAAEPDEKVDVELKLPPLVPPTPLDMEVTRWNGGRLGAAAAAAEQALGGASYVALAAATRAS